MTNPFFKPELTAEDSATGPTGARRSLQYLFDDVFAPDAHAAVVCEPFSNDTPAPSGQTMREPPYEIPPKRPTLHLPSCPRGEPGSRTRIETAAI
jgi:hypothetical protein